MEHFDKLDSLVNKLVEFCAKQTDDVKYAAVIYSAVKLLLSNYSVVEARGILSFVDDELKREKPCNMEELTKRLYI